MNKDTVIVDDFAMISKEIKKAIIKEEPAKKEVKNADIREQRNNSRIYRQ